MLLPLDTGRLLCAAKAESPAPGGVKGFVRPRRLFVFRLLVCCACRGKKFNVLRQRVDSVSLQVDQLLLGCLLFTVAVCIFPTVLIFYVSYLLIWLFIFTVHAALRLAVLLVCRWPFYLLLCRIRQPELFSTAVRLRRVKATWQSDPTDSLYFFVDPIAVPLADVLRPAADLAVAATLSPLRPSALLSKAARGEVIAVS